MKNIKMFSLFAIVILSPFLLVFAADDDEQEIAEKQVPTAVLKTFKAAYPNAKDIEYTKEKEDGQAVYEIEFELSERELEALYNADGKLLEVEEEIGLKEVPAVVLNQLKKEFKSYEIEEVERVNKDNQTYYELEVEIIENNQEKEYELLYSADGKLVKREIEKDENEEDDDDDNDNKEN